jgi:hypothetical protein
MYLVGALLIVGAIEAAAIVALLSERRCARVPSGLCATGHDARLRQRHLRGVHGEAGREAAGRQPSTRRSAATATSAAVCRNERKTDVAVERVGKEAV